MAIKITVSNGLTKFINTDLSLSAYTKELDKNINRNTPVRTGKLRDNRTVSISDKVSTITLHQPYAGYVEDGTKPHIIRPKTKKALRFNNTFAKKVNHPGFTGRKFIKKSLDETNTNLITDAIK